MSILNQNNCLKKFLFLLSILFLATYIIAMDESAHQSLLINTPKKLTALLGLDTYVEKQFSKSFLDHLKRERLKMGVFLGVTGITSFVFYSFGAHEAALINKPILNNPILMGILSVLSSSPLDGIVASQLVDRYRHFTGSERTLLCAMSKAQKAAFVTQEIVLWLLALLSAFDMSGYCLQQFYPAWGNGGLALTAVTHLSFTLACRELLNKIIDLIKKIVQESASCCNRKKNQATFIIQDSFSDRAHKAVEMLEQLPDDELHELYTAIYATDKPLEKLATIIAYKNKSTVEIYSRSYQNFLKVMGALGIAVGAFSCYQTLPFTNQMIEYAFNTAGLPETPALIGLRYSASFLATATLASLNGYAMYDQSKNLADVPYQAIKYIRGCNKRRKKIGCCDVTKFLMQKVVAPLCYSALGLSGALTQIYMTKSTLSGIFAKAQNVAVITTNWLLAKVGALETKDYFVPSKKEQLQHPLRRLGLLFHQFKTPYQATLNEL